MTHAPRHTTKKEADEAFERLARKLSVRQLREEAADIAILTRFFVQGTADEISDAHAKGKGATNVKPV